MDVLTWILVGLALAYAIECVVWPYKRHWRCKGAARLRSPATNSWRDCPCEDGQSVRWGRVAYEMVRKVFR